MTTLDAPAAVAASICWLARWRGQGSEIARLASPRHPSECGWCIYPPEQLIEWVEEFNDEDLVRDEGGNLRFDDAGEPLHRLAASFHRMPRADQRALVDRTLYPDKVPA